MVRVIVLCNNLLLYLHIFCMPHGVLSGVQLRHFMQLMQLSQLIFACNWSASCVMDGKQILHVLQTNLGWGISSWACCSFGSWFCCWTSWPWCRCSCCSLWSFSFSALSWCCCFSRCLCLDSEKKSPSIALRLPSLTSFTVMPSKLTPMPPRNVRQHLTFSIWKMRGGH